MGSLLEKYGWHEWLCHTNFSFLIGGSHPDEYVSRATQLGYSGLAITDYDGVYGIVRAYRARKKMMKVGKEASNLKLFYGAEVHFGKDHELPLIYQDTVVLIAQSRKGYRNLCRLLSYSHRNGKRDAYIPLADLLASDVDDLVAICPMRGLIRQEKFQKLVKRYQDLKEHFNNRCYLTIGRFLNPAEDAWIKPTYQLATKLELALLLSQDPYFHEPQRKPLNDVLQAMRLNKTVDEVGSHLFVNSERCLHSLAKLENLYKVFPFYERSLRASYELAESCSFDLDELRYQYPKEMIPEGYDAQSYLDKLTVEAAKNRYGEQVPAKLYKLLMRELQLVASLRFADYFLTVWDIVRWARSQNILCQGRGSAANSLICYVLGITSVDPDCFEVLFERFISAERGDPPDIDVDFEHERREEVIQYIYERYGRQRAAMVANVITFKSKGAVRFTGKALGIPDVMLDKGAKILSVREYRRAAAQETIVKVAAQQVAGPMRVSQRKAFLWAEMAEGVKGFPRHLGIHSGGFVVTEKAVDWLVAQEPATMSGRTVIQWSKEDIEALGFFKIDVLALGMLTAIRKCFSLVKEHYGVSLDLAKVPNDDPKTYAMIQRADTVGTFQIESRAQMSMLPRLRPKNFYDLVIEVAIIRPGPIQGGMIHPFLKRRHGSDPVTYAHPKLVQVLKRTLGVPIFQEQVMRIAMEVGDFTPGEADELRRNMGAWQMKGDLGPWVEKLVRGMKKHGIDESFIEQLIGQLKGFSEYGFPESHAASFALLAYASSYLKCHYPAAYCTALLNSQPMGFYSPNALIREVMRHGVSVLPVCINHSQWDSSLEVLADGSGERAIRLGFRMVSGLREQGVIELLNKRSKVGVWSSLDGFLRTTELHRGDLTSLAAANALQVLGVDRRGAIWLAEAAGFAPYIEDVGLGHAFARESNLEKIQQDFRSTGACLGEHPSLAVKKGYWCFPVPHKALSSSKELASLSNGQHVHVFGMVLVRQAPPSAKGMVFFTLEDDCGYINLVFTPQIYERFTELINSQGFLCVSGKLQRQHEGHSILVRQVYAPTIQRAEVIPMERRGLQDLARKRAPEVGHRTRNYM